jgi:hypothetical protein
MMNCKVAQEMEVALFKAFSLYILEEIEKTTKPSVKLFCALAEIRTANLPNKRQKFYRFSQLARV